MRLDPNHTLAPESIEFLGEVLGAFPSPSPIQEELLVRFALGTLELSSEDELISRLVRDAEGRDRLLGLLEELSVVRRNIPASQSPLWGEIAAAIRLTVGSYRSALTGAVHALTLAQRVPAYSSVRSGSVFAEIDENGDLRANITAEDDLLLADPGGAFLPLGKAEDGEVVIAEFAKITGLTKGPLPSAFFSSASEPVISYVFVERDAVLGEVIAVELREPLRIQNESLRLNLGGLPEGYGTPDDAEMFEVWLPVGNGEQLLLRESAAPWRAEGRIFEVPVPGVSDVDISTASILRLRLHRRN